MSTTFIWRSIRPSHQRGATSLSKRRTWYADTPPDPQTPPETPAPESTKSGAVDSGEEGNLPDWVKDPTKAYEEIQKLRNENAQHRKDARSIQKRLEDLEKGNKVEEEKRLADEKKWEELASKRAQEIEQVKAELAKERLDNLKRRIGSEFNLPAKLVARLQGATEDELRRDAEELAKDLGLNQPSDETTSTPAKPTTPEPPARSQQTTTAVPGGQPVGRTDTDRRREYFGGSNSSPMFSGGKLLIHSKGSALDE